MNPVRTSKKAARFVFLFLIFQLSASCIPWPWGLQSEDVRVVVEPFGKGDELRSSAPLLRFNRPLLPTCRPFPVTPRSLRNILSKAGFDVNQEGGVGDSLGIREPEEEGTGGPAAAAAAGGLSAEERERERQPVLAGGVGDRWLSFGLYISNGRNFSGNADRKEYLLLVIEDLTFTAQARVGNETREHGGSISGRDYCGGPGFLYLIPGGKAIEYQPTSNNPLHNLTVYLSGFPVIDNRNEPEALPAGGEEAAGGGGAAAARDNLPVGNCIVYIPRYRVRLTLSGYFMTTKGTRVQRFTHRTVFHTTAFNDC